MLLLDVAADTDQPAVEPLTLEREGVRGDAAHLVLHLDAAYNLARWLVGNRADAQDVVQEAYLRAVRSIHTFRGSGSRPWLLAIVRNTCYDWLRRGRRDLLREASTQEIDSFACGTQSPEAILLQKGEAAVVHDALNRLPPHYREIIILRDFEQLSYKHIATIVDVPQGTVMSRLFRARKQLEEVLEAGSLEWSL
jgi:RNA polymerase sigma factor (sigma-70 family)